MSRLMVDYGTQYHIAWGKDHACGYFIQIYTNGEHEDECLCPQCEYDQPALDKDSFFDGLSGWEEIFQCVRDHIDAEAERLVRRETVGA